MLYRIESPDGDQGFPGRLKATVRYSLVSSMVLQIDYFAEAESDTVVNLTNHAYFNLNGDRSGIDNHEVWINSEPLRLEDLRGNVVIVEFWTYG